MGSDSEKNKKKQHVLFARVIEAAALFIGFMVVPCATNDCKLLLKWADWTGFGADTIRTQSTEKNAKGQIQKTTATETFQSGKTLWDVLELAGTVAVPILLLWLGNQLQNTEKKIAAGNLRDEALQAYFDRMSELLLDKSLINSQPDAPARDMARTWTLTILRRLGIDAEPERKASVLYFLYDAKLVQCPYAGHGVINLNDADLSNANLSGAYLDSADLRGVNLSGANLSDADLRFTNLSNANLKGVNLTGASLIGANLSGAKLNNANWSNAKLNEAFLSTLIGEAQSPAELSNAKNLTVDQVKNAYNWEKADYDPELHKELGLPLRTPGGDESSRGTSS